MAVKLNEIYHCKHCGIIMETVHPGSGAPICCNEEMSVVKENTVDASLEKHVPVIKRYGDICFVQVGSVLHPMTVEHHIVWVELHLHNRVIRHYFKPGEKPEAEFNGIGEDEKVFVRAFCNIHGLWSSCTDCDK